VELPDLLTGIAAAQQADIFVGPHGANIANAWLMRPGSSVVELTMYEFDDTDAHMNLAKRNMFVSVR
jgi:capsular polysaccharide biosynthesis protein